MRFWLAGPRLFGGLIRPGISFGLNDIRSRARAALATDYVYVITGDHGLVKIGISTDPNARLSTLQTASPHRLRLAFTAPAFGNSFTVEQEAHQILSAHRVGGEWFSVSPDLAIAAVYAAADRTGCSLSAPQTPSRNGFRIGPGWWFAIALAAFYAVYLYHMQTCGYYCR